MATVKFVGRVFRFGEFPYHDYHYYKTISCGYHLRYVYHVMQHDVTGTLFAVIEGHRLNKAEFKPGVTIDNAKDSYVSKYHTVAFWIFYIVILVIGVSIFVAYDNDWLEDRRI